MFGETNPGMAAEMARQAEAEDLNKLEHDKTEPEGAAADWVEELTKQVKESNPEGQKKPGEVYIELPAKDLDIVELKRPEQQGPVREWVDEMTAQVEAARQELHKGVDSIHPIDVKTDELKPIDVTEHAVLEETKAEEEETDHREAVEQSGVFPKADRIKDTHDKDMAA